MLEKDTIVMDRYRVLEVAGKGGMGRVYHVLDIHDGSHWAMKEDLSDHHGLQLREEATVLSELDHPALPKTRGVLQWQGNSYMIMQYMHGQTLTAKLKKQEKYPQRQVLYWFVQIAEVLCYLHSRPNPIVYRDLKPSNIIIDENERVRIIDFGIAEEYARQNDGEKMHKIGLTRGYAAPEQYNSRFKADVRTDIYALGATIHYLLTGKNPSKPPYGFVPVRRLSPEVTPAMEEIVKKCLQPNPDQRYENAEALYNDLIRIEKRDAELQKKRKKRIVLIAGAVAVALGALLLLETVVKQSRQEQIQAYSSIVEESRRAADAGDYDEAVTLAREAIAMQPNEISGYLAEGYSYMVREEYDQCRIYISLEILDRFPDCYENADFLTLMAQMYDRSGKPEEALFYYRERCVIAAGNPEFWLDLADCQIRLEMYAEAENSLQSYLSSGGDEAVYRESMTRIEKSR